MANAEWIGEQEIKPYTLGLWEVPVVCYQCKHLSWLYLKLVKFSRVIYQCRCGTKILIKYSYIVKKGTKA